MKPILLLIVSSIFLSNMPNYIEKDSTEKIMNYKIEKAEKIKFDSTVNLRTPIIIVKKD